MNQNINYKVKGIPDPVYGVAESIVTSLSEEYVNNKIVKEVTDMAGNEFKNTGLYSKLISTDGKIINAANIGKAGHLAKSRYGEFLSIGKLTAAHNVAKEAQKYKDYKEGKGTEKGDPGKQLIIAGAIAGYLVSEYGDDAYADAEKHGNKVWGKLILHW